MQCDDSVAVFAAIFFFIDLHAQLVKSLAHVFTQLAIVLANAAGESEYIDATYGGDHGANFAHYAISK